MDQPTDKQLATSEFYARWGRWVLRYRRALLSVIMVATVGLAYFASTTLTVDNSVEAFAPPESVEIKALKDYRATFGRADPFLVLIKGDVFTRGFLERLRDLHGALDALRVDVRPPMRTHEAPEPKQPAEFGFEGDDGEWGDEESGGIFGRITSLINVRQTRGSKDGIRVEQLMTPLPSAQDLTVVKRQVLSDSFLVGQVVDREGQYALLTAYPINMYDGDMEKVTDGILEITRRFEQDGFKIHVTGPPAIASLINKMVISDLVRLGAFSLALVTLVLIALFRHWLGVLGPVLVILVSVFWTLGAMAALGLPVTILSGILPAFLLCVGVCDSIHLMTVYRSLLAEGHDNESAIIDAVSMTGAPIFFTSVTTICGLLSLNFASVTVIAEMGIAGGVGVAFAWLFSVTLLPALLCANRAGHLGRDRADRNWMFDGLRRVVGFGLKRPRRRDYRTLVLASVLAVLSAWGVSQIEVYHDDLEILPDDSSVKIAVQELDEFVGGAAVAELVIRPTTGTLKDLEILQGIDQVVEAVLAYRSEKTGQPLVTHIVSIVDVLKETRRAFNDGRETAYRLPKTQAEVNDLAFVFENQSPEELGKLTTLDWSKSHISMRVKWQEATDYQPLLNFIDEQMRTHLSGKVEWVGTGPVYVVSRLVQVMLMDLAVSFGTAFGFVCCFMFFMLRSFRLGLIAILPNLFPIALVLGAMGVLGLPLDLNSLLIASIALGIAVDDTVHFLHHFKTSFGPRVSCQDALRHVSYHAGQAMITTSIVLTAGFAVLCFAENAAVFRFGFLTALTIAAALLTDLIVLPALLRRVYGDGETAHE
ncbi:MAG: efflux RND transporter permease subunit [Bradymonadia bacterium]